MTPKNAPLEAPANLVITGATGFVGRYLVLRLVAQGYRITALVRNVQGAIAQLGQQNIELVPLSDDERVGQALAQADALIHLAGAPVTKRWTAAHKRAMWESRIGLAKHLDRLSQDYRSTPIPRIVSASGIGIYGDQGSLELTEDASLGDDYLAKLAIAWEEVWQGAKSRGSQVACLRIGVVLGLEGGFLSKVLPSTEQGLGAVLGDGRQYLAWIHLQDLARMIEWALQTPQAQGVYNACAPNPLPHQELVKALAKACGGKAPFRVPAWLLSLAMGEMANMLCTGQNARPQRALAQGFEFEFPSIHGALNEIISGADVAMTKLDKAPQDEPYIKARRPDRQLRHQSVLHAPLDQVFAFFSTAQNLSVLTPPGLEFAIITPMPIAMKKGALIDYKIDLGAIGFGWRTRIDQWDDQERFVDVQLKGPYACWYHEHRFERIDATTTKMVDTVYYRVGLVKIPLGPLGRLIERRFVRPKLRRIFSYRERMIQARFGSHLQAAATQESLANAHASV